MLLFKEELYFNANGIVPGKMCPVLVEEGQCSKFKKGICPDNTHNSTIDCVFARAFIINKYKVK